MAYDYGMLQNDIIKGKLNNIKKNFARSRLNMDGSDDMFMDIFYYGHLDILKFFLNMYDDEYYKRSDLQYGFNHAYERGHEKMVKYLSKRYSLEYDGSCEENNSDREYDSSE